MPDIKLFYSSEAYYSTLFHELAHNAAKKIMTHLTVEDVEAMSDKELATAFLVEKPKVESSRGSDLEALLPELADKLKKRGVLY